MVKVVLHQQYHSAKAIAKRARVRAESRLPQSYPIRKPRPLTPEELIDKYPAGWMCAPVVPVPAKMQALLDRSARAAVKAVKRERYLKRYRGGGR
jgi:hypothetical protein